MAVDLSDKPKNKAFQDLSPIVILASLECPQGQPLPPQTPSILLRMKADHGKHTS